MSIEIGRIGMQCQHLKSTQERLVEEHSKTLERVNELWKQKWPGAYDEVSERVIFFDGKKSRNSVIVYSRCSYSIEFLYFPSSAASLGGEAHYTPAGM